MFSIQGSTTQWEFPSIMKTVDDSFPFFMAAWQVTQKNLHNMIHKYWFHIEVYFCFTGYASSELQNEQVGEEEGTVDEPEKMPEEQQQPPHRQTPLQKSHTPISQSGQGNPGTSSSAGKQKEAKRHFYDLSEAVKQLWM
jgi:hypothetical protein